MGTWSGCRRLRGGRRARGPRDTGSCARPGRSIQASDEWKGLVATASGFVENALGSRRDGGARRRCSTSSRAGWSCSAASSSRARAGGRRMHELADHRERRRAIAERLGDARIHASSSRWAACPASSRRPCSSASTSAPRARTLDGAALEIVTLPGRGALLAPARRKRTIADSSPSVRAAASRSS